MVTPDPQCEGDYLVVDGNHRLKAAILGRTAALRCIIKEAGGLLDAFEANVAHGLPLSRDDRRRYAALLHEYYPELSEREIGRRAGVSASTVSRVLGEIKAALNEQPSVSIETTEQCEDVPEGVTSPSPTPISKIDEHAIERVPVPMETVVGTVERLLGLVVDDVDVVECAGLLVGHFS